MPIEVLESVAYSNYYASRPRPFTPALIFDLVKIRRLVDEATDLVVRAASGISTSVMQSSSKKGMFYGNDAEILGLSTQKGMVYPKLSRERQYRMRDQATQKLFQAYCLDEIAASVITMQSASALEDVAKLVLDREEHNPHAQYVHFFHEKIPSMAMAEHTSLHRLNDVISQMPTEPSLWRTRAVASMFKNDIESVVRDCTHGLTVHKLYHPKHQKDQQDRALHKDAATGPPRDFQPKGRLAEKDQPSSTEPQLLCLRGTGYLGLACGWVSETLHGLPNSGPRRADDAVCSPGAGDAEEDQQRQRAEARKFVRAYAKRALQDFLVYLSHFEYTPGLPSKSTVQSVDKVNGPGSLPRTPDRTTLDTDSTTSAGSSEALPSPENTKDRLRNMVHAPSPSPPVYKLNELFAAVPPPDLSACAPEPDKAIDPNRPIFSNPDFAEVVTYHPLLLEALHSVLLCHCLLQTSTKELQRHAYMVARVTRVADEYPLFLAPRSQARADWKEILIRMENWIGLERSWSSLCRRVYLVEGLKNTSVKDKKEPSEGKGPRTKHTADMQALAGERIAGDEKTQKPHHHTTLRASQLDPSIDGNNERHCKTPDDWDWEDEYSSKGSDRANAIVGYLLDTPPPNVTDGAGRSKKRSGSKRKSKKMSSNVSSARETVMTAVGQGVESLELGD
ncbi:hypothetical protein AYO21_03430 [Fonsecaea monophora]|uniref:Uncharacterized protein n=1 Tax=Fonsecaea monophora TaxID=254056 RepID=A0A177FFM8_9EURO|nr:hypothetical protein AYO21_03430 [Fonsecaea monophora]KAH0843139.1 hypothetical protein FOPE_07917 [Fonsecaea pedrosoi]OAG42262.1 hypothetical protein AYO21_03430 [Fonsecaea monophora]